MKALKSFLPLLIGIFLLTSVGFAAEKKFSDVEEGSYYEEAVNALSAMGIINGYSNGNFGPADSVNRAQLATILYRYDQQVVSPVKYQLMDLHRKGRQDLEGASWQTYMREFDYYDLQFSSNGEGMFYDENLEYFETIPEGFVVAYDGTTDLGGMDYGIKVIAFGGVEEGQKNSFYIWYNSEIGFSGVFGFFYDDINRLIKEAE